MQNYNTLNNLMETILDTFQIIIAFRLPTVMYMVDATQLYLFAEY